MGRYANFHSSDYSEDFTYKFWFGIQDSVIPWVQDHTEYFVIDYDEDDADYDDFTEEQKEIWQKYERETISDPEVLSPQEKEVLQRVWSEQYIAVDDDSNLDKYWADVRKDEETLDIPAFKYDSEKDFDELYDTLVDYLTPLVNKGEDEEKKGLIADYCLKVLICCMLQRWGCYRCNFDKC